MSDLSKPPEHGGDFSHYRILDKLGGGGMGVVYRAEDSRLERFVALKFLPPELGDNPESKQRFVREAKAASALDHPNICTIYDIGEAEGRLFIAMACYRGETLKTRLERGRLPAVEAVDVIRQVAEGLAAAHERGIVHRDIKPANLFLVENDSWPTGRVDARRIGVAGKTAADGAGSGRAATDGAATGQTAAGQTSTGRVAADRVKILDFGLAKTETDADGLTQTGLFLGTPAYMSPEQARGEEPDARSDLFSLGVVFFELLNGRPPFAGVNVAALIHALNVEQPAAMRPDVPPELERIISKLLERDLNRRYGSCSELLAALERWSQGSGQTALPSTAAAGEMTQTMPSSFVLDAPMAPPASPSPPPAPKSAIVRYGLPAGLAVLALVAVLWVAFRGPQLDPSEPGSTPEASDDDARPSVAVLFFDNRTGDPALDWLCTGLADMLVTDLSQSPDLRVLSTSRMYRILKQLDLADTIQGDTALAFTLVEDIAAQAGVERIVLGSVSRAGTTLRIDVKVQDAASAEILSSKQVAGEGQESLFSLVDDLSFGIRQGFELPPDAGIDSALAAVTTSSIEAYRLYVEGMRFHLELEEEEAISRFEKAVEIDPEFAMAWAKLAVAHGNLMTGEALEYIAKALEYADRLPPVERYYVEGIYNSSVYHRWPRAITAWENMIVVAPDEGSAYNNLALMMNHLERYDEALDLTEVILQRSHPWVGTYGVASEAYAGLGQYEEAAEVLERALEESDHPMLRQFLGWLMLRRGDFDQGGEELAKSMALRPQPNILLGLCAADLLRGDWRGALELGELHATSNQPSLRAFANRCRQFAYQKSGRPDAALAIIEEMIAAAPKPQERARFHILAARIALQLGRFDEARSYAMAARREASGLVADTLGLFYGTLAEIKLGRFDTAREQIAEYGVLAGALGFKIEERYHRRLLAELALAEGEPTTAVAELEQAASTLPVHGLYTSDHWPDHVPLRFSLAQAYLAIGDAERAVELWRRIVEATDGRFQHPMLYVRSLYLLANHHRQQGEQDRAAEYFRRFLACWGDGDLERGWVADAESFLAADRASSRDGP